MKDRKMILGHFLQNELFLQSCGLSKEEVSSINFSNPSQDLLIEAMKKLIFSYCQEEAPVTVIRNVNIVIENNI